MITYDLCCSGGHKFEGWFSSSADFDVQCSKGMLICPVCSDVSVHKALSVPNVGRKGNQITPRDSLATIDVQATAGEVVNVPALPPAIEEMMQKLASVQAELLKDSQWVGREFAETARAMHYGETDNRLIHGETGPDEAEALAEEGVSVAALPFPFIPPEAKN